jgi:hypothetical protein
MMLTRMIAGSLIIFISSVAVAESIQDLISANASDEQIQTLLKAKPEQIDEVSELGGQKVSVLESLAAHGRWELLGLISQMFPDRNAPENEYLELAARYQEWESFRQWLQAIKDPVIRPLLSVEKRTTILGHLADHQQRQIFIETLRLTRGSYLELGKLSINPRLPFVFQAPLHLHIMAVERK